MVVENYATYNYRGISYRWNKVYYIATYVGES